MQNTSSSVNHDILCQQLESYEASITQIYKAVEKSIEGGDIEI